MTGDDVDLKRDDQHVDRERRELRLPLLQLQQVFPAGESGQVPVEYEQQPSPAVVVEAMRCAAGICEVKVDRGGIKAIGGR